MYSFLQDISCFMYIYLFSRFLWRSELAVLIDFKSILRFCYLFSVRLVLVQSLIWNFLILDILSIRTVAAHFASIFIIIIIYSYLLQLLHFTLCGRCRGSPNKSMIKHLLKSNIFHCVKCVESRLQVSDRHIHAICICVMKYNNK